MSKISEKDWKKVLTNILEELDTPQYKKMLENLKKIPKHLKTAKNRVEMPKIIIEHYGLNESISEMDDVMDLIPRRDSDVQDLLHPFVDQLKEERDKKTKVPGKKRKFADSESEDKKHKPAAGFKKNKTTSESDSSDKENVTDGFKKNKIISDSESSDDENTPDGFKKNKIISDSESSDDEKTPDDQQKSPDEEKKIQPWRKTIYDLKTDGDINGKIITAKVVQKSGLRTYVTKKKEKKFHFILVVADETASIRVMVYGRERYQRIMEKKSYMFRNIIMDDNRMKVTKNSTVSMTKDIDVPEEVETQMFLYRQSQVCSIAEVKMSDDKSFVSVEGTITQIYSVEQVTLKNKRQKKKRKDFRLKDDKDDIIISLWGEDIKQFNEKSAGDFVRVTNVKTNHFRDTVSLNSTDHTRIIKVPKIPVQNVRIEIMGITTAGKMMTHLEAEINNDMQPFVVASKLLADAFKIRLEGDFEEKLLQELPLSADVELKGSKITKIKLAEKM